MSVLTDPDYAREELLEGVMERAGVEADLYEAFRPLVDVGAGSRMGFLDRRIARTVMAGLSGELEINMGGRNNLRDWGRIREYAHRFAESPHQYNRQDLLIIYMANSFINRRVIFP